MLCYSMHQVMRMCVHAVPLQMCAFTCSQEQEKLTSTHNRSCALQVIFALPPENGVDYTMRIFNSDGSEPEMCGNGIRCLARFVAEKDGSGPVTQRIHTLAGTSQSLSLYAASLRHGPYQWWAWAMSQWVKPTALKASHAWTKTALALNQLLCADPQR